jgi:mucin-22
VTTVQKTFAFASDLDGLVNNGAGQQPVGSWLSSDGSPANGCLNWHQGTKNTTQSAQVIGATDGSVTWETWGVPAGATVNTVRVVSFQKRLTSATKLSSHSHQIKVVGSDGSTSVHGATDLASESLGTTTGAWAAGTGIAAAQSVIAGKQASNTPVALYQNYTITTSSGGGSASVDQNFDTILIEIDYTATETHSGTGSLATAASLSSAGKKTGQGSGDWTGSASLTAAGVKAGVGSGSLSTSAALAPVGQKQASGTGSLSSSVSLTATGVLGYSGFGSLALVADLTSGGTKAASDNGGITLSYSGTAGGTRDATGSGSLSTSVSLTGVGSKTEAGASSLSLVVSLVADGTKTISGTSSLSLMGTLEPTGQKDAQGAATLTLMMMLSGSSSTGDRPIVYWLEYR